MDASPNDSNAYTIYTPVILFMILCPMVVGIRLRFHGRARGQLGMDDFVILVSLVFSVISGAVMLVACTYGYGRHWKDLEPSEQYGAMKYFFLCQITYKASINLTKASVLFLYMRIFAGVRWFRWTCLFVITSIAMFAVSTIMTTIMQCHPITKAFDRSIEGHCINNGPFWFANAAFNIATDIIVLSLPMPLVKQLKIPRAQKIGLALVFALGIFVVITSCLRVTTIDVQAKTTDKTYDIASTMWTIIEMNVAIICACLPQARPLLTKLFPKLVEVYRNSYARGKKSTHGTNDTDGIDLVNVAKPASNPGSDQFTLVGDRETPVQKV